MNLSFEYPILIPLKVTKNAKPTAANAAPLIEKPQGKQLEL